MILLLFSLFIALLRFLKGPSLTDRVITFDVLSIMSLAMLVIFALYFKREIYLDIALVFGLIGFLGTTVFGRYIEKGI
jgi:multicomponent Na+:H+ antiporter subunit F